MSVQSPQLPKYRPPAGGMPPFISADPSQIENQAVAMDRQAYALSDADFRQRYPQLYNTQQNFLGNLNQQMTGGIAPQMQNVWATSGAGNAVRSTGGWSLGAGTAGMANVARNLGLSQMGYQNQLLNQFNLANDTFRPRTFGLTGGDAAQIELANIAGRNNWNQTDFAFKVQESQYEEGLAAQQAVLNANARNAETANWVGLGSSLASLLVSGVSNAAGAGAFGCWVARAVYGANNPRWLVFRQWLLTRGPAWLRWLYGAYGERFANWIKDKPRCRAWLRAWMERLIVEQLYAKFR